MDFASFDTREKVDQVLNDLPDDAKRPYIVKMDPQTVMPIMTLNVSGMDDQRELRKFTDDFIKRDLEKVEGVAAMDIYGGLEREIQVLVDRNRLAAYNVSVQEIEAALKAEALCEMAAAACGGFAMPTIWFGEPRPHLPRPARVHRPHPRRVQDPRGDRRHHHRLA